MTIKELVELLSQLPAEEQDLKIVAFSYRCHYLNDEVATVSVGNDLELIVKS